MKKEKFTLAVCQLRTELEYEETMSKAEAMLRDAAASGAEIAVLPEMFSCPYNGKYFHAFAEKGHEDSCRRLSEWARKYHLLLVGGSVPESADGLLYNTSFVYDPDGNLLARHRKVHLFDVDLPGMRFQESASFSAGEEITVFDPVLLRAAVQQHHLPAAFQNKNVILEKIQGSDSEKLPLIPVSRFFLIDVNLCQTRGKNEQQDCQKNS